MFYSVLLFAIASLVTAANDLSVTNPTYGETLNLGVPYTIKWNPSLGISNVDLILKSGNPENLKTEYVIAKNVMNSGVHVWSAPFYTKTAVPYSLMIQNSHDSTVCNFSPFFTVLDPGFYLPRDEFKLMVDNAKEIQDEPQPTYFDAFDVDFEPEDYTYDVYTTESTPFYSPLETPEVNSTWFKSTGEITPTPAAELITAEPHTVSREMPTGSATSQDISSPSESSILVTDVQTSEPTEPIEPIEPTEPTSASTTEDLPPSSSNSLPKKTYKVTIKELNGSEDESTSSPVVMQSGVKNPSNSADVKAVQSNSSSRNGFCVMICLLNLLSIV